MPSLPQDFLDRPIAHRGYHDRAAGRPENSRGAIGAAIQADYGIEIDLQLSADGEAMVFHDYDLGRLTKETGPVRTRDAGNLSRVTLRSCDETIPRLSEVLDLVSGRAALLIELKDQDGAMGADVGALEAATARVLSGYRGPVAVMSFNPHSVAEMARLAPDLPRGLTSSAFALKDWPTLPAAVRKRLRELPDVDRIGAAFVSHHAVDLGNPRILALKAGGLPILTWTIRSPVDEARARRVADNVTFEGYAA